VKPGDDFFMFANGGWIKRTAIPPEYSRWGAFNELVERNNDALHVIAEKASQTTVDPRLAPETQKVGDYYASGMDEKAIEAARATPLAKEFQNIDAMKDRHDVLNEIAHLHSIGINAFFNFGSGQDAKDSTHDIAQAVQGGLGMPDRDYYTKQDADMKEKREKYVAGAGIAHASRIARSDQELQQNGDAPASGPDARLELEQLFQRHQPD
jgi:putative endopeptidase